jgi:hypothetical protein
MTWSSITALFLQVLDAMMTSFDVFTSETESNLALGYVMAAQLHVRSKTPGNLTLASEMIDAALGNIFGFITRL